MRRRLALTLCLAFLANACSTVTAPDPEFVTRSKQEIAALHQFFEDWFAGELPNTDQAFARFADALHADFHIIGTDGTIRDRAAILAVVKGAHGRFAGAQPPFVIEVRNTRPRATHHDALVVTYEEWQGHGTPTSSRISTAVLRPSTRAPGGIEWLHVHETAREVAEHER